MHPERALRVINNLDVPASKRKFWPQEAVVFVRTSNREIVDVIQFFARSFTGSEDYHRKYYMDCRAFFTRTGQFSTVEELEKKIAWCFEEPTDSTNFLGRHDDQ